MQDKKKINEIATPFQPRYLQYCFLLSVNQKGMSKKIFKRIWQVVETTFLPQKSLFLLKLAKISNFSNVNYECRGRVAPSRGCSCKFSFDSNQEPLNYYEF